METGTQGDAYSIMLETPLHARQVWYLLYARQAETLTSERILAHASGDTAPVGIIVEWGIISLQLELLLVSCGGHDVKKGGSRMKLLSFVRLARQSRCASPRRRGRDHF